MARPYMTIMILPDGDADPRRLRLPGWLYRAALAFLALVVIAPILYVVIFYDVLSRAADAHRLSAENDTLRHYQAKIEVLQQSLLESRKQVSNIAAMAGLDSTMLAGLYAQSDSILPPQPRSRPQGLTRTLPPTSTIPDALPVTGWISQEFSDVPGKRHDGLDLVVPEGTTVRSTAFGAVSFAGTDPTYGQMIVVHNNDSIETVYGHNSQLLVQVGDTIFAGQQIALSGNTGKSSAPHVHYEIRIHGTPVNPIQFVVHDH